MELKAGWLERQLKSASDTFNSWPIVKQQQMRQVVDGMFEGSRAEAEERFARRFDPRHGNF